MIDEKKEKSKILIQRQTLLHTLQQSMQKIVQDKVPKNNTNISFELNKGANINDMFSILIIINICNYSWRKSQTQNSFKKYKNDNWKNYTN